METGRRAWLDYGVQLDSECSRNECWGAASWVSAAPGSRYVWVAGMVSVPALVPADQSLFLILESVQVLGHPAGLG